MSWSMQATGDPEAVVAEIERYGASISGQCKAEFDDAKPHMIALVQQNYARGEGMATPKVRLTANGSGTTHGTEEVARSCQVHLEVVYG